ncbi:hypothetical protein OG225_42680 (plasmid) [Nocardia sp. NBC_01377]|uniref:hypothetical protein n=1 Tax=Nocardia sp. NBC_01377 TaxID=2903595 RepID=UPI002F919945
MSTILDDGTGSAAVFLTPLVDALCSSKNPASVEKWLRYPGVGDRLRALATGDLPLTHEAFSALPRSHSVRYLRELLMSTGLLPQRNPGLLKFDEWTADLLSGIAATDDRQALATYIRWHHRHRILQQLDNGALRASAFSTARQQSRAALDFLNWLRARGTLLAECTQHDIDDWFADGPTTRLLARIFMTFAIRRRLCPKLRIPNPPRGAAPAAQPQPERIALIRELFTEDTLPPIDRVAGLLVLLYAMPATRIAQIRLDDVTIQDGQVFLRIAEEDLPMPEPLDSLITDLITQRRNMGTAANPTSPWLLPGQRPNRPISTARLRERLRQLGVTGAGRVAALNELLREIPAPVLADLVGCNPKFAAERASLIATDWSNYAAIRARRAPSHP